MQKREADSGSGPSATPAKHGRPFGSTTANIADAADAGGVDASSPSSLLGPSLHLPASFAGTYGLSLSLCPSISQRTIIPFFLL